MQRTKLQVEPTPDSATRFSPTSHFAPSRTPSTHQPNTKQKSHHADFQSHRLRGLVDQAYVRVPDTTNVVHRQPDTTPDTNVVHREPDTNPDTTPNSSGDRISIATRRATGYPTRHAVRFHRTSLAPKVLTWQGARRERSAWKEPLLSMVASMLSPASWLMCPATLPGPHTPRG